MTTTLEEFCRNISAALDHPSLETKQKNMRPAAQRIEFRDDQVTIKRVIQNSDVRLQLNQLILCGSTHNEKTDTVFRFRDRAPTQF